MSIVHISREGIEHTLNYLKLAGKREVECVVLWLAKKQNGILRVQTVFLPQQTAEIDYFHISQESVSELLTYLRNNRLMVAAQVHSHPCLAFHSLADDKWAIIRHVDGLSLVIPYFAATTSVENFISNAVVFKLSDRNQWDKISAKEVALHYRVLS